MDETLLFTNLKIVAYVKGQLHRRVLLTQWLNQRIVASLAILIYDTVITLDQEYRYVWQRKWHFVDVLYLVTRYATFIDTTIAVYERLDPNFTDCDGLMTFTTIFSGFGIGLSELILMIRTYALYDTSKKILAFFVVLWLSVGGVNFWAVMRWTQSFDSYIQTFPPEATMSIRCYLGRASNIGLVCYMSLLAGETVIVLMTVWKVCITWWTTTRNVSIRSSPLIVSFYRDGILFYCCILPFTIINVIALLGLPEGLFLIADTLVHPVLFAIDGSLKPRLIRPLRVIHSILACRLVLHIRHIVDTERETTDVTMGSVGFLSDAGESETRAITSRRSSTIQSV
ncbi:hypothetical protein PM082_013653 [Marasmius tenuissimus]|nr:hypothetical protein PM082_013653 [Marasmius tenuissimus]